MKRNIILISISAVLLCFIVQGCQDGDEGCLDPNALNLDVTADINANCNYPSLRLNISHRWVRQAHMDTLNFRLGDAYFLGDDSVTFSSFQFFISNTLLGGVNNLYVFDSVETIDEDHIRDDLTLITPATFQFITGQIDEFGTYSSLSFDLGFNATWYEVDTVLLEENERNHPWFAESMRNGPAERYTCRIGYTLYGGTADSLTRQIVVSDTNVTQVTKLSTIMVNQANHADVGLFIDYMQLLQTVDLRHDDDITIKEKLKSNLDDALEVIQ